MTGGVLVEAKGGKAKVELTSSRLMNSISPLNGGIQGGILSLAMGSL